MSIDDGYIPKDNLPPLPKISMPKSTSSRDEISDVPLNDLARFSIGISKDLALRLDSLQRGSKSIIIRTYLLAFMKEYEQNGYKNLTYLLEGDVDATQKRLSSRDP